MAFLYVPWNCSSESHEIYKSYKTVIKIKVFD